jgi:zinc protease
MRRSRELKHRLSYCSEYRLTRTKCKFGNMPMPPVRGCETLYSPIAQSSGAPIGFMRDHCVLTRLTCKQRFFALGILIASGAALAGARPANPLPKPVAAEGFTHVTSLGGIDEYRLDANGLDVLIKPDHSAPVVTFNVVYRVGSRNEVTGTTGATHILEHLMFKGSEHFNDPAGNSVKRYMEEVGARYNATTSYDRTNYFGTLGKDSLEGYVAIEADRMRNLWLHEADRQKEMTVVRNEYERSENNPGSALGREIWATAYQAHPYHHETIGWKSDIEKVPIEKLRDFYDTFYWPDNATVIVVGDVEPANALRLVRKYYGSYPRAPHPIPQVYTEEPAQTGARRLILKRAGQLGMVEVAWKGPNGLDPDTPALDVLGAILSTGKNSRLSRALVDKSLVTEVGAEMEALHDPSPFQAYAQLAPGVTHEQVEKALLDEVEKVKKDGVTLQEVGQVISQYRAEEAYRRDGTSGVAEALNEWVATGDWTQYVTYIDKIAKVTPADVQRVARKYLNEDQSTTGWFVPTVSK